MALLVFSVVYLPSRPSTCSSHSSAVIRVSVVATPEIALIFPTTRAAKALRSPVSMVATASHLPKTPLISFTPSTALIPFLPRHGLARNSGDFFYLFLLVPPIPFSSLLIPSLLDYSYLGGVFNKDLWAPVLYYLARNLDLLPLIVSKGIKREIIQCPIEDDYRKVCLVILARI